MDNEMLAKAHDRLMPERAEKLRECAQRVTVVECDMVPGDFRVLAYFCRIRLCPLCTWRRSMKNAAQMYQLISAVEADKPRTYMLLTLTLRNCTGEELSDTLTHLLDSFARFTKATKFIRATIGFYRGVEVTYNREADTYHPHIHVLLVANKSYFSGKNYLRHEQWQAMWRKALKADYDPSVDVRRIRSDDLVGSIAEVSKYAVKPTDMIMPDDWDLTEQVVMTLTSALHNRRFVAFGGILRDYHKRLHLSNPDDPEQDTSGDPFWSHPPETYTYHSYVWDALRTGFWLDAVDGGRRGA